MGEEASLRMAAIDLGTVSSRMLCAEMHRDVVSELFKRTVITDLGEGVDATGGFSQAAVERVVAACDAFVREAREHGVRVVCTTLTSAARDASNGGELLARLRGLGLEPQVISGEIEARLTFYGVARDFGGRRIAVADSGGGSTELVIGSCGPAAPLALECAESLDIGCRRVTERFFSALPPSAGELEAAAIWVRSQFEAYWNTRDAAASRPERLVAVGGTVTSLVAMAHGLAVYDPDFVHLRDLTIGQVEEQVFRMSDLTVAGIAALPGVQAKRAPVLLAGGVIVRELMRAGGYDALTVSENGLLAGSVACMCEMARNRLPAIGWTPELAHLG